jgi:hypothetical protein
MSGTSCDVRSYGTTDGLELFSKPGSTKALARAPHVPTERLVPDLRSSIPGTDASAERRAAGSISTDFRSRHSAGSGRDR